MKIQNTSNLGLKKQNGQHIKQVKVHQFPNLNNHKLLH